MANGSLDSHLFKENSPLAWETRFKIAHEVASGLLYLHDGGEKYVVHRDVKASNIMLDSDFNAKLGDFGLARSGVHGKALENSSLEGTIGYVAPEYATFGRASKGSDVFSFGSVALEIACGRKIIDRPNFREWVWDLYGEGKLLDAVDPRLNGEFDKQQVECLMIVGLWCVHPDAQSRPTMEKAIHVLKFVAPLPQLPSEMPITTIFAPFSSSSGGTDVVGSNDQSPIVGGNPLLHTIDNFSKRRKFAKGDFFTIFRGFQRDLNFGWLRGKSKDDFEKAIAGPRKFSYKDLVISTDKFSTKLGEGGYGAVYRGFLKELNCYVAVKVLSRHSKQGLAEYKSEVTILGQLRHRNLVKLIGWCRERNKYLLVYELMSNSSLDSHLFKEDSFLAWEVRYKIAKGLVSALLYLQEEWDQYVVHRDIKPSNVMLDSDFNPKLGDFGLARSMDHGEDPQTTIVAGTSGYLAPEYVITGKASKESDMYSFGIVALEIACGRRPIVLKASEDQIYLVHWVWSMYGEGKLVEAADPRLNGDFDEQQAERLLIIGLLCAHPDVRFRPSVREAIKVLNFEAPLPFLPLEMPESTYFASPF